MERVIPTHVTAATIGALRHPVQGWPCEDDLLEAIAWIGRRVMPIEDALSEAENAGLNTAYARECLGMAGVGDGDGYGYGGGSGYGHGYGNSYGYGYGYGDSYGYGDGYIHGYGYGYGNGYIHGDGHGDGNGYGNGDGDAA